MTKIQGNLLRGIDNCSQGEHYLQDFGLSKGLSNHLKTYIHGSQNWFQIVSRSKSENLPAVLRFA